MSRRKEKEGKFPEFRALLRNGIGTRSQKQFAEETGLSRGGVNRLLNEEVISRPTKKTLLAIAAHTNVDTTELFESCGYETPDIRAVSMAVKNALNDVFSSNIGHSFEGNVPDLCLADVVLPYANDYCWTLLKDGDNKGPLPGKIFETWAFSWRFGKEFANTYFTISMTEARDGEKILCGTTLDADVMLSHYLKICFMEDIAEKIGKDTSAIIGRFGEELNGLARLAHSERIYGTYEVTDIGCGFYYNKTPDGFMEYVMNNAEYFCVNKETQALYRRLVTGENPDEVFKDYEGQEAVGGKGTGNVIADILTKKTGHQFLYLPKNEEDDCSADDSCIMQPNDNCYFDDAPFDRTVLKCTYEAARTLGIKKFGTVYHVSVISKSGKQMYDTDNFHYEFRTSEEIANILTDKDEIRKLYEDATKVDEYYRGKNDYSMRAGRIAVIARHALDNKNDTIPTKEMAAYIEEEIRKIEAGE